MREATADRLPEDIELYCTLSEAVKLNRQRFLAWNSDTIYFRIGALNRVCKRCPRAESG